MSRRSRADRERLGAATTGPICGGARYSPAGRRTGNALVVGENEDKVEKTKGNSLK